MQAAKVHVVTNTDIFILKRVRNVRNKDHILAKVCNQILGEQSGNILCNYYGFGSMRHNIVRGTNQV